MICIPITAKTEQEALDCMETAAARGADIIELRIDCMESPRLGRLLSARKKPVIVTCRKKEEGGFYRGSEDERIALLKDAISLGAEYVDVELSSGSDSIKMLADGRGSCRLIVSFHNLKGTPADIGEMRRVFAEMEGVGCDIAKVATFANDIVDNIRMFESVKDLKTPFIAVCMGEKGELSRILYRVFGSFLTYAALDSGMESAAGQIQFSLMKDVYRADRLNRKTRILGTIGRPARYSRSFYMFNPVYEKLGLNLVHMKFEVDSLDDFLREIRKLNPAGFSVTTPYKEQVIRHLDSMDENAGKIGAVNTISVRDSSLIGHNTDGMGAKKALLEKTAIRGKVVVIIGAGGAAKSVAFELSMEGCRLFILNRTVERARQVAEKLGCGYGPISDLDKIEYDILINCTTVGMSPNDGETPVPKAQLRGVVMDVIYKPPVTRLLKEAKEAGCMTVDGLAMLLHQATGQFELWTGKKAPIEIMRESLWKSL